MGTPLTTSRRRFRTRKASRLISSASSLLASSSRMAGHFPTTTSRRSPHCIWSCACVVANSNYLRGGSRIGWTLSDYNIQESALHLELEYLLSSMLSGHHCKRRLKYAWRCVQVMHSIVKQTVVQFPLNFHVASHMLALLASTIHEVK